MSTITAIAASPGASRVDLDHRQSPFIADPTRRGWSRRSFLGAFSAMSVAGLAGCGIGGGDPQALTGRGGATRPGAGTPSGSNPPYEPVSPFAITAACELSEDYFLFENHQIDPTKDKLVAYSRADGEVEAMLLQDGAVKQIYRDPTQAGGWNVYVLPDASSGVTDMVAGVSNPKNDAHSAVGSPTLKVFYVKDGTDDLHIAVHDAGDVPAFTSSTAPWSRTAGRLQLTVSYDDSLLVVAIVQSTDIDVMNGRLYYWADTPNGISQPQTWTGQLTGFAFNYDYSPNPSHYMTAWSAVVARPWRLTFGTPSLFLVLPEATGIAKVLGQPVLPESVDLWRWTMTPGHVTGATMINYGETMDLPPMTPSHPTGFAVELATTVGWRTSPTVLVRTAEDVSGRAPDRLWLLSPDDGHGKWTWTELQAASDLGPETTLSTGTRPLPASETIKNAETAADSFLDVFLLTDRTLSVIRQAPQQDANADASQPVYCPAIPLQPDVALMTSQAGQSSGNELLLVGTDGGLQSLVKDPVTGHWADLPVHVPSSELEQVSAYQVTLSVLDSWDNPVPQQSLRIGASTPVTALVNGTTLSLSDSAVTAVTDSRGEVHLALVADGLSAPTLTVSGTGVPTTTVYPSGAVNTYMQGGTTLNALPAMSAETLTSAKTPDGKDVAPGASDKDAAADAAKNMSIAATQAAGAKLSARRATSLQRRDGHIGDRTPLGGTVTAKGVLHDINAWSHDALHAIKKGAVAVESIKLVEGVFELAADLVDWADKVIQIVVQGIEDAAHVIHAFFNKLGADIKHAVQWLMAEVIGTLKDSVALAHQYDGWLQDCCTFLAGQAKTDAAAATAWLVKRRTSVHDDLVSIANGYADGTNLSTMADNPPRGAQALRRTRPGAVLRDDDDQSSPHPDWFLNKVKKELFGALTMPSVAGVEGLMKQLLDGAVEALRDFETAFADFGKFLVGVIEHPAQVHTLGVKHLLLAVAALVDAMFDLAQAMLAVSLELLAKMADAIPTILGTELGQLGVVGKLLSLVGLGKVTYGTLISIIFAFPAVVAYKVTHGGRGRPFAPADLSKSRTRDQTATVDQDLKDAAGAALITWATLDGIACWQKSTHVDPGGFFTVLDIASPVIVGFLTVPSTQNGQPYFTPPVTGSGPDQLNFVSWLASIAPAGFEAAGLYLEHSGKADPDLPAQLRMISLAISGCGVFALGTGCQANHDSAKPNGGDYAVDVLNSMADIVTPLIDAGVVGAGIACAVTMICGISGGYLYGSGVLG